MPHFTQYLSQGAPFLNVLVGPNYEAVIRLERQGRVAPAALRVRGLIDTGASHSSVDPSVLSALRLSAAGLAQMHTASTGVTSSRVEAFDISLLIPAANTNQEAFVLPNLRVHAVELTATQNFDALIGRDVLQHCVLTYNGAMGWFTLAY